MDWTVLLAVFDGFLRNETTIDAEDRKRSKRRELDMKTSLPDGSEQSGKNCCHSWGSNDFRKGRYISIRIGKEVYDEFSSN